MKDISFRKLVRLMPEYLAFIPKGQRQFTALDIFDFEGIPDEDKLFASIRANLIGDDIFQEFACRCAEWALGPLKHPDPRSAAAIAAKRAWVRGEISDAELAAAREAAREAAIDTMASGMATEAEKAAATAAEMAAAKEPLWAANSEEEWAWLVAQLKKLLKEAQGRRSSVRESKSNGGK